MSDPADGYGPTTARFYDAAYATLPGVGADASFYGELAQGCGGPVLELGCGTGRALLPIAAQGLACTGLDASQAMLAVLRARAGGLPVRAVHARMQGFDLGRERFALIFSAFRAFQHLVEVDEQLACLASVRRHLRPGGTFAFDVFQPRLDRLAVDDGPEEADLRFEQDGEQVERFVRTRRDRAAQVLHLEMRYERRREGRVVGEERTAFRMRWFHRFELLHLLHRAGFSQVAIHGDFDRSPVGPESPALVAVARG